MITNQICLHKEIRSRLNSENILSSRLLPKTQMLKHKKTTYLAFVLCRCKTCFLALGGENNLRVLRTEYRAECVDLRGLFGLETGENLMKWIFTICICSLHQILLERSE
jgi:hypothetical protein